MKDASYKSITENTEGFYKEKGSKFISLAFPASTLDEVKEHLEQVKKKYYDARHHCYAYVIRSGENIDTRANDDGEPGHSAGDPILNQIKSFDLQNVLVVVVRYFGGTKLGVSGLITAYKTAAKEALSNAKVKLITIKQNLHIQYPYDKTNEVMRLVGEFELEIISQKFESNCEMHASILPSKFEQLNASIELLENVKLSNAKPNEG